MRTNKQAAPALTMDDLRSLATTSVEEAGQVFGLGRTASYAAASRGDLPTIKIGKRLIVPVPALLRMLGDGVAPTVAPRVLPIQGRASGPLR